MDCLRQAKKLKVTTSTSATTEDASSSVDPATSLHLGMYVDSGFVFPDFNRPLIAREDPGGLQWLAVTPRPHGSVDEVCPTPERVLATLPPVTPRRRSEGKCLYSLHNTLSSEFTEVSTPTKPPKPPGKECKRPPLLEALHSKRIHLVEEALRLDGEAAKFPFWEHQVEPPLCAAIRYGNDINIICLLLEYGAEPDACDIRGRRPVDVLHSSRFYCKGDLSVIESLLCKPLCAPLFATKTTEIQFASCCDTKRIEIPSIQGPPFG